MANALDIIQVRYGQKTGEEKTISYPEFLALDSAYLSAREKELQEAMKKLYQLNQNKPPLFKEFPSRFFNSLTINALTLTTENCRAHFVSNENVIEFNSSAFNYELFSTLVHELKHAEDWTHEYADMVMASRKDGLAYHQLKILLESRARACELTAIMADCLNKKKSFAEFQTEFAKDDVFEFVQTIMPEIKKRYEKALTTGQPFDIQDLQQLATVAIVPSFVASPTYQEYYRPRYNEVCKINPDDKGQAALPSSWGIASKYHKALLSVLGSSFKDGEAQDKIPIDVLKKLNIEADFSSFLFKAVTEGKTKVVQELIKAGANVNENDGYGYTPLRFAILNGKPEVAQVLIKAGADVNENVGSGYAPLFYAIYNGKLEVAQVLIEAGADVNVKDKDGWGPLHLAALAGHTEVVKALIQAGAKMEEKDKNGYTPLHLAIKNGTPEVSQVLIEAGADVNVKDKDGNTPLHLAAWGGHTEMVKALVQAGAKMEEKDKNGNTPLHLVAWDGRTEVVKALIQAGAKMEEKDKIGNTPLHSAIWGGHTEVVKALIQAGAKMEEKNKNGDTPLHFAVGFFNKDIIKALIQAGADVNAKDNEGKTVADLLEERILRARKEGKDVSELEETLKIVKTAKPVRQRGRIKGKIKRNISTKEEKTSLDLSQGDTAKVKKEGEDVSKSDEVFKPVRKRGRIKGKVRPNNSASKPNEANATASLRSVAKPVAQREDVSVHSKREGRA